MRQFVLTFGIIAIFAIILLQSSETANALTRIASSGDFGGKSASINNLKQIDKAKICFVGLGDYMYNWHPDTPMGGGVTLGELWDNIGCKVGFPGNHEELKHQEEQWAQDEFKYGTQGYGAWKLRDIGVIGLSAYTDFQKGSKQYDFVVKKSNDFSARDDINQIVYVTHEPLWSPSVGGGHGPNVDLRNTYADIIKSHNGFLIQAHNHVIAFGDVDGVNQAMCGGGGYGGDTLGKLNGWEWATAKPGYCVFRFNTDSITAEAVDTTGTIMKVMIFAK